MSLNSTNQKQDFTLPEEYTLTGTYIPPITTSLPKTIDSICPDCLRVIECLHYEEDGKVMGVKECPDHGVFKDIIFSDARLFLEMEKWYFGDGRGFHNPQVNGASKCPSSCGICNMHTTHTSIANIDLTSRCNLSCNVCFADSNKDIYEPEFEDIVRMLEKLREQKPVPGCSVQYTGGEPTIHPRFLDIVRKTKELGFTHIQVATNGIKLADREFAKRAREAGLQYIYLQIDGVDDEIFRKIRGRELLQYKLEALESAREAGLRVVFVPTILKGINDHQIGPLMNLAFENLDIVTGISIQPVVFTGRYPEEERLSKRYTLADMVRDVGTQTGLTDMYRDWFPMSSTTPFLKLGKALTGRELTNHTCHHHCVLATLLFVDEDKNAVPITQFLDYYNLLQDVDRMAMTTKKKKFKIFSELKLLGIMKRHFNSRNAPAGLTFKKFLQTLDGYTDKKYSWDKRYKGHTY
ncbi:MAG: radical SAM protein, partial [Thermodesulfobacteriota bacterium]